VLIADYYLIRRTQLDLAGLYRREGPYWYLGGYNPLAMIALAGGILPCLPGFCLAVGIISEPPPWTRQHDYFALLRPFLPLYDYAWFVSFGVALITYVVLMNLYSLRTRALA